MNKRGKEKNANIDSIKENIKANLKTIKNTLDDYETTPDSIDFQKETAILREALLQLAIKFHILIDGHGSKELREGIKKTDPTFAQELQTLAKKKGDKKYQALEELATEVAAELIFTIKAVGGYRLSPEELQKKAAETMEKINATTRAFRTELNQRKTSQAPITPSKTDTLRGTSRFFRAKKPAEENKLRQQKGPTLGSRKKE